MEQSDSERAFTKAVDLRLYFQVHRCFKELKKQSDLCILYEDWEDQCIVFLVLSFIENLGL